MFVSGWEEDDQGIEPKVLSSSSRDENGVGYLRTRVGWVESLFFFAQLKEDLHIPCGVLIIRHLRGVRGLHFERERGTEGESERSALSWGIPGNSCSLQLLVRKRRWKTSNLHLNKQKII